MLGAIIGDIVGSRFEFGPAPEENFKLFTDKCGFTDDTVCTIAVADAVLNERPYDEALLDWCARYPHPMGGYGNRFWKWVCSGGAHPMDSCGNGSAMRVSAVGWLFDDWQTVKEEARKSAEVSHDHPEGIKGAQCVAEAIFWLRNMRFLKDTSLVYILAMNDLMRVTRAFVQRDFDTTPFLVAAVFYLVCTAVLTRILAYVEKRYAVYEE